MPDLAFSVLGAAPVPYCVAPTRPLVSGGLLFGANVLSPTPTPSKLTPVGVGADTWGPWKV